MTAFLYKGKCYEHIKSPFGLKIITAAFLRDLNIVLGDLNEFVIHYVENIVIASESELEHLQNLETILNKFEHHNITLNFRKCKFKVTEVTFLGYIIFSEGIRPDPDRIQAIKKQLHGFMGTVNFSAKLTEKFAKELFPFLVLLKKGNKWK